MTIGDLLAALRRFRLPALALFVMIFGIGVGSLVVQPSRYESEVVLSIATKDGTLSFDAQQAVEFVVPPTVRRLTSSAFERSVRERLAPTLRDAPIDISASSDPGTTVINVSVESSSPEAALNMAQIADAQIRQEPRGEGITIGTVSPATQATSVKADRAPRILGGTFLLGLILAVLFAAIAHRLRPLLPRGERFRERYGHEVLGEIPQGRETTTPQPVGQTLNATGSPELVEAFRSLEARVVMRIVARDPRYLNTSIAFTSWGDHDGKSTVATSLAWTIATRGRRVTVVDCDMRKPSAHALLGVPLKPGVADITEARPPLSTRHGTTVRTLDVIPAGAPQRHPSDILHEALPRLLAALQERMVIIDTPPMFTAEATAIVGAADLVVLVADYRERTPDEVAQAIAELELSGTPILGVVLNRVTERDTAGHESHAYRSETPTTDAPKEEPASEAPPGQPDPSKPQDPPKPQDAPRKAASRRRSRTPRA